MCFHGETEAVSVSSLVYLLREMTKNVIIHVSFFFFFHLLSLYLFFFVISLSK